MLTESALFFINLCNEYRDLRHVKVMAGVSEAWVKQKKVTKATQRRRHFTDESNDDAMAPSSAASRPSKKRITASGVAVIAHAQPLPSNQPRKTSTSANSEKACDKEPVDVQAGCRYGGLEDEDDGEEWEAIRQSLVKPQGVRISDHVHHRCVRFINHANGFINAGCREG